MEEQATLNVPSLIVFGLLSFLAIRYFFFSPAAGQQSSSSSSSQANAYPGASRTQRRQVTVEKIEMVHSMFPQLDRRRIEWDLVRNGGSVQATTEKVLREGRLEEPPPNFQAQPAPATAAGGGAAGSRDSGRRGGSKPAISHADLITRYDLSSKVAQQEGAEQAASAEKDKQAWSSSKVDRQALLKQRREEMVLAARRKMEEKMKSEKA